VKATNAYAAKRALIDRLTALSQVVGHPLEGVQVGYARPSGITDRCVYGGKARFVVRGDDGDAEGQTAHEVVTTEVYVRALGRGLTYAGINAGVADFWPVDDGTEAILALSIDIGSWLI
jgi:hypothetical protein